MVDPTWKNGGTAYVGVEIVDTIPYINRTLDRSRWDLELKQIAPDDTQDQRDGAVAASS